MRQGQQNRRGRGRGNNNNNNNNNNNRKGQNPLTRSFESNGPDMKIRGTPAHVAEKYMSLARDALSSGDPVLAENYLQHAEHYNRIILTHREQQLAQQASEAANVQANPRQRNQPGGGQSQEQRTSDDNAADNAGAGGVQPDAPQPDMQQDNAPRERTGRTGRTGRQEGGRTPRSRNATGSRSSNSRTSAQNGNSTRSDATGAADQADRQPDTARPRDRFGEGDEQPQFLRRPVRRTRAAAAKDEPAEASSRTAPQPAGEDPQD